MFVVSGAVSLLTFKNWAGLSSDNPVGIFIVTYIVSAIFLFVYVVSQIILVVGTLEDRWPLGDISFGVFFFVIGQVILYVFSDTICNNVQHYLDGLFFATICNLLAVMMVYKVRCSTTLNILDCADSSKNSTGIPSRARISNFLSASSNTTGRSRSCFQRRTSAVPYTRSPSMRRRCTSNHTTAGIHTTPISATERLCSLHRFLFHIQPFNSMRRRSLWRICPFKPISCRRTGAKGLISRIALR